MESEQFEVSYAVLPHGRLFTFLLSRKLSRFFYIEEISSHLFVHVPALSHKFQSNSAFHICSHVLCFAPSSKYTFMKVLQSSSHLNLNQFVFVFLKDSESETQRIFKKRFYQVSFRIAQFQCCIYTALLEVTLAFKQFGKYVYLQKQKYFCIESITLSSLCYIPTVLLKNHCLGLLWIAKG